MKTYNLYWLILLVITLSCEPAQQKHTETPTEVALWMSEQVEWMQKDPACTASVCSEVNISYPKLVDGFSVHDTVNQLIGSTLREQLAALIGAAPHQSVAELSKKVMQLYQEFRRTVPESETTWYLSFLVTKSFICDTLLSLRYESSNYMGGAHPNAQTMFQNVNASGKSITRLMHFFSDTLQIRSLAEAAFRQQAGLAADSNLAAEGYLFENNEFQLTPNFGFTKEGLVFYYNNYEIAPYAAGPTEVLIPYEQLQGLFRPAGPPQS